MSGNPSPKDSAAEREWTLPTFDDDFLSLVESEDNHPDHAGIICISHHRKDVGEIVRCVDTALERNADRDLSGEITYA